MVASSSGSRSDIALGPALLGLVFLLSGAWSGRLGCTEEPIPAAQTLYCNGTLANSKDNRPVPTIVALQDYCPTAYLDWNAPSGSQLLQFSREDKEPFVVCLDISRPGIAVYQLVGRSKRPLASSTSSADAIPCQPSHCGNFPLLLEADEKVLLQHSNSSSTLSSSPATDNSSFTLQIAYQHFNDCESCPQCTDSCMKSTLCSSEYVLLGRVKTSTYLNQTEQSVIYLNELQIEDDYIRYNGSYSEQFLDSGIKLSCDLNHSPTTNVGTAQQVVPTNGTVLIYSSCRLEEDHRYLIGADLLLNVGNSKEPQLMLGCAQENIEYARYYLQDLLRRGGCCL